MTKVLIVGATGYVGRRVADALVRSGQHRVWGLARSNDKAMALAAVEITPVVCPDPINEPEAYLQVVRQQHIDVVVDVASPGPESAKFLTDVAAVGADRLRKFAVGPKLGFVSCSGTWVHGSSNLQLNDLDDVGSDAAIPPSPIVAWRPDNEKNILASRDVLDIAIVRPALIYGRENTIWAAFLLPLLQAARTETAGPVRVPLEADSRPALVHVDDVATGFQIVIEKLPLLNGGSTFPVFDLVTSQESMKDIFDGFAATWGLRGGYSFVGTGGDKFAEGMSASFRGSSARAKQLLGWEPKRVGVFVADIDIFAASFASQH